MNTIIEDLITKWGITVNPTLLEYIVIMFSFFSLVLVLYLITKLVFRDASSNRTMFVKCALVFIGILVCLSAFADFGCNLIYGGSHDVPSEPNEPVTPSLKDGYVVYENITITQSEFDVSYDGILFVTFLDDVGSVMIRNQNGRYNLDVEMDLTTGFEVFVGDEVSLDSTGNIYAYIARETTLADAIEP